MHCLFIQDKDVALAMPALLKDSIVVPKIHKNAIAGPYAKQWKGACKKESGAIKRFLVFDSKTPCPAYRNPKQVQMGLEIHARAEHMHQDVEGVTCDTRLPAAAVSGLPFDLRSYCEVVHYPHSAIRSWNI